MSDLTNRQEDVFKKLETFFEKNGRLPKLRELAELLNTNNFSTAQYYMDLFKSKGLIGKNDPEYLLQRIQDLEGRVNQIEAIMDDYGIYA